jgi:formylglycine-generating enzyme required for sulfatase activity
MADIFLSYAREDETRARALAAALGSRGWSVFWDRRIPHGRDFRTHIQQQLDSARCIVVLWSSASVKSQFVLDEATEGQNDGRLVPALIEAVRQPLGFRGLQAASLADWTGVGTSHDELERLVSSIGEIVPPSAQAVPATAVAEVAVPATTEVEGNAKHVLDETDAPAAESFPVAQGPQPVSPPASVGGHVDWRTTIKQRVFQPPGGVIAAIALAGLLSFGVWQLPVREVATDQNVQMWMPVFVEIAAGPFTMGSDRNKDPQAGGDEVPQHQVTLPTFFIGRNKVTVGQFKACAEERGCTAPDESSSTGIDDSVKGVSWHQAIAYCAWLERKLKSSRATPAALADALAGRRGGGAWHVTLPSEAEWEKAMRGEPPADVRDTMGFAWEWTRSHYKPYPYRPDDGRENIKAGDDVVRAVRGDGYVNPQDARVAVRSGYLPGYGYGNGFRVVVSPFQP